MKPTPSKQGLVSRSKSRSTTYSQNKQHRPPKHLLQQGQSLHRTTKTKPKDKQTSLICKRDIKEQKLKTIMTSTLDLLRTSSAISTSQRSKNQKPANQLIDMAESIHSLVSLIVDKDKSKASKKTESFITVRETSLNKDSLLKYFETKLGGDGQDEQSVERRLRNLNALKKSQSIMSKYQSQSVEDSEADKENRSSLNERSILRNVLSRKDFGM